MKTYIISSAICDSRLHKPFWASIGHAQKHMDAEIIVQAAVYRNPSAHNRKQKADDTYPPELLPFLTRRRKRLGANLTLFADVPAQPTKGNPTAGLEALCAETSAIIGHPKRQMHVVPTASRTPRVIWTTSACTLPKYSKSLAGAKAKEHHVIGALIVEVCSNGVYFVRNVSANSDGSFTDLDVKYTPGGVIDAPRALSVVLGDIHVGAEDPDALVAAKALVWAVEPKNLMLHDLFDGSARSHHDKTLRHRFAGRNREVEDEVFACRSALEAFSRWSNDMTTWVIDSNHHDHLERWLEEHEITDSVNTPYWHRLWASIYDEHIATGKWPITLQHAIELANGMPMENVVWPKRTDAVKIGGVVHGLHGDVAAAGARGSLTAFVRMGSKVTAGHTHEPAIRDAFFRVGVTGKIDMGYAMRGPTTWLHAHVVLGDDGKRQMVVTMGKKFRGGTV